MRLSSNAQEVYYMNYISSETKQYKANLHCHSNISDGKLSVDELIQAYKDRGYDILAITDHEAPYDHSAKSSENFMLLTGYEAYIRPSEECKMDPYGPEIHINLLAKEAHNTAFIGYDPKFAKYIPADEAAKREKIGDLGPRRYNHEFIQKFIDTANAAGYLVTYNHPVWSMEAQEDILSYDGFFSLEIFNTGSVMINGMEDNLPLYNRLCRLGKLTGVHGADDNHNKVPLDDLLSDSFGAWTMIMADELSYEAVIKALEEKRFYASTGPTIKALSFEGKKVHLEFTDAQRVMMHGTPKRTQNVYNSDGSVIVSADFEIPDYAPFVHFSIVTADGKMACTRAFTRKELGI